MTPNGASPEEPAFAGVKADLQLAWRVVRVHVDSTHDLVVTGVFAGGPDLRGARA